MDPEEIDPADIGPLFRPPEIQFLRDRAYDDIRDAILSGRLRPGQRIKERAVADQMRISTTPVKEALRRLEQEGLIVSQPRRGAVVSPLVSTPEREILELRADLEGLAARLAAEKMNAAAVDELRDEMVRLERLHEPTIGRDDAVFEATARFHALIHAGSGNAFLVRFLSTLAPFDRTVRRIMIRNDSEWLRDAGEHQSIVSAIEARDGGTAERVMHEHIRRVIDFVDRRS